MAESSLNEALTIFLVGMSTVFLVLCLVVLCGNILVRFINRLHIDKIIESDDPPDHKQIILRAVQKWSEGRANVKSIRKL